MSGLNDFLAPVADGRSRYEILSEGIIYEIHEYFR